MKMGNRVFMGWNLIFPYKVVVSQESGAVSKESEAVLGNLVERGILAESDRELEITEEERNLLKIFRK